MFLGDCSNSLTLIIISHYSTLNWILWASLLLCLIKFRIIQKSKIWIYTCVCVCLNWHFIRLCNPRDLMQWFYSKYLLIIKWNFKLLQKSFVSDFNSFYGDILILFFCQLLNHSFVVYVFFLSTVVYVYIHTNYNYSIE